MIARPPNYLAGNRLLPRPVLASLGCLAVLAGINLGCAQKTAGPVVIYLDGAGWYSSAGSVESGLRDAGYSGDFQTFSWSAYLGPAHDHLINAGSKSIARRLARKIEKTRDDQPDAPINLLGLSAGTAVILSALEQLKAGVQVDNVVLFSPSVSADHVLNKAMAHVKRNLYATASPHDAIIKGLPVNADGKGGPCAGKNGFRLPPGAETSTLAAYRRVITVPWQPSFVGFGWNGSHTSVTTRRFVSSVIAPRVLMTEPYPLDRSVVDLTLLRPERQES